MVTSSRAIVLGFAGDVEYTQPFTAQNSSAGSGQSQLINLAAGNNSITVPANAVAVTILFPADNTVQVSLKKVNGDTGLDLHLTDPTSIGLNSVSSFVLSSASDVTVRLIFS